MDKTINPPKHVGSLIVYSAAIKLVSDMKWPKTITEIDTIQSLFSDIDVRETLEKENKKQKDTLYKWLL